MEPIQILWEDATCLVVNKPNGLLTTAARGIESLETRLRELLADREPTAQKAFVGLPHRIDRPVSGAVLVGKNAKATKIFCAQFQSRKIEKSYIAAIAGRPESIVGRWTDWMRKYADRAESQIVDATASGAKEAVLDFEVMESHDGLSLVRIRLETGRTHQIRLQCSHRGHPIVGDALYGSNGSFGSQSVQVRERAIALHAHAIGFRHPQTAKPMEIKAPLPMAWADLGFRDPLMMDIASG